MQMLRVLLTHMLDAKVLQIAGMEWFWVLIVIVALLFGANRIPEIARAIGRAMGEFQRGKMEIEREIEKAKAEVQKPSAEIEKEMRQASAELNKTPERLKLEEAAKALGIDPAGKSDEQLREEIKKAV